MFTTNIGDIVLRHPSAHFMRNVTETIGGIRQLFMIALRSRFRMKNSYWRWRYETAFGSQPDQYTSRAQRLRAMIDYGRWVHRMKRAARRR